MRDIIFRGKRLDNDKWIYGYVYADESGTYIKESNKGGRFGCGCPVEFCTVGQFTGMTDLQDKRIWEDDIIEGKPLIGDKLITGQVFFDQKLGRWAVREITDHPDPDIESLSELVRNKHHHSLSIIGTIHENPYIQ